MKIASYNVNSIRRRLPLVLDWVSLHKPDVICLQETKVQDQDFLADAFRDVGYHATFRGMKGVQRCCDPDPAETGADSPWAP
jgi:exodeoxyribonuclease III